MGGRADRDTARARVEQLTAELTDARHQLGRLEVTHQMLLELAGAAGPPLPPAYRDILAVLNAYARFILRGRHLRRGRATAAGR